MALTKISTAMISQSAAAVDLNVDAGTFYVDTTNNRVGVGGKTDPDTPLHVVGTVTATLFAGSGASLTSIPNSALTNSSITINSTAVSLGGSLTLTTANIGENTNLYYTDARADARIAAADTDDLSEGSSNLYYTDARVDARVSGGSLGNITTTGYIRGPATFTLDPAAHGDNSGTVVIAGNLQVDGTTTTINSTTLTVDDKNITLASGSANAAAASGAGFTVDIGSGTLPAITYDGTNDEWDFNKPLNVTGNIVVSGTVDGVDIASRDAVLTSTTTTAGAALPKAGGTMTGQLTINNTADYQLLLTSPSSWTGIAFNDSAASGQEYIWHNGTHGTFAIGGNGSNIANKKLHVNGGMTIGSSYGGTAVTANSLNVQGDVIGGGVVEARNGNMLRAYRAGNSAYAGLFMDAGEKLYIRNSWGTKDIVMLRTGEVGIGTDAPAVKLDLRGDMRLDGSSGTDRSIYFRNQGTIGGQVKSDTNLSLWAGNGSGTATQYLTIKEGGNVGIGTTAPYGLTHWQKSSTVNLVATNAGADGQADATVMSLIGQARGYSNNLSKLASIDFKTDPTTWYYGAITFNVANLDGTDTSRTPLEAMRINRLGNVGIGETSPDGKLHIKGSTATGDASHILFENTQGSKVFAIGGGSTGITNGNLYFRNVTDNTRPMVITDAGNVGIGIDTPSDGDMSLGIPKVHVYGGTGTGSYALLQRFQNGSDADNTGASIVLNHSNDRGIIIEGGRSIGNRSHGAIKSIDNVGRVTDAFKIFGGTGAGVNSISLFTGESTTTTERMRIDSSGNVGIGVTPKTDWHTGYDAIQIGESSAFFGNSAGDEVFMVQNARYTSSGWKYNSSGTAALFDMQSGSTRWRRAASGSNDGALSWSETMFIDTSGNINIGTTNTSGKLHVHGSKYVKTNSGKALGGIHVSPTSPASVGEFGGAISFSAGGTGSSAIAAVNDGGTDTDSTGLAFFVHGSGTGSADATEVVRIDELGKVGIGTISPNSLLEVNDGGAVGQIRLTRSGYTRVELSTNANEGELSLYRSSNAKNVYISSYYDSYFKGGNVGIGKDNPLKALEVYTNTNTGGIQITGGASATNTSLHISNGGSGGVNWNITSTGGGHGYGEGQLQFGVAYAVPKMRITSSGNVGIGHATGAHTPQKVLEVECPSEDFVTLGARTLGVSSNWAGIHFGYKENSNNYRKSAIVFERTDLTSNNAQGKVHIFNGPQAGSGSATLADRAFTINEDGSVELGRPNTLLTEDSYALQNHQILFKPHQSAADEAVEEKSACFSKIWRKSAVLHPGKYSNGNWYVGIGVSSADTSSYVVYKMNVVKCKQIYARAFTANSADSQTRTNVIYYSTDDTNWHVLSTGTWTSGGNTREAVLDTSTMAGAISGFYTGTIFLRCSILGGGTGHVNLVGWNEFEFKARAQSMDLEGGGFGLSKNDLTLSGIANTGHGYTPLTHSYGHQYSGTNQTAIVASNSGTQTFASKGFGHEEYSIFKPVTNASIGANGMQIMKTGLLHCTFNQDIITIGSTSYASCTVRRYNESLTNSVTVCSTLRTNTDGHWDMINGDFICDVVAGDIITFTYAAGSISAMDGGTWANYNFMLHPTAITSQGTAGTNLPWVHQ